MTSSVAESLKLIQAATPEELQEGIAVLEREIELTQRKVTTDKCFVDALKKLLEAHTEELIEPAGVVSSVAGKGNGHPRFGRKQDRSAVGNFPHDGRSRFQHVYDLLKDKGPMHCSDIAKHFNVYPGSIYPILNKHRDHHFVQNEATAVWSVVELTAD